jgi:hypothetical protein
MLAVRLIGCRHRFMLQHSVAGLVQLAACLPVKQLEAALMPAFGELCTDPVWSVRQDCANALAELACHLPRQAATERLLPLWRTLAGDVSVWVQAAARRQTGPLLTALHPDDCPDGAMTPCLLCSYPAVVAELLPSRCLLGQKQLLLERQTSAPFHKHSCAVLVGAPADLIDAFVAAGGGPASMTESCAAHLPSVLRNLTVQRWQQLRCACRWVDGWRSMKVLHVHACTAAVMGFTVTQARTVCREAAHALAACEHPGARIALACGLAELAELLGPQTAAADLLPVLQVGALAGGAWVALVQSFGLCTRA